jgi:hypothetical protein
MLYTENERILSELEQVVKELETKMPLTTLEQRIPKAVLKDIKPIIDRLKVLQEAREGMIFPDEREYHE